MKSTILSITLLISSLAYAAEHNYERLYVFGDSLSDAGNVANTEARNDGGRFSNGPVWNEYLAKMLNIPVPTKSKNYQAGETPEAGNTNFFYAGAMTDAGTTGVLIPIVKQQIEGSQRNNYVGFNRYGTNFSNTDLVSIWGGANNLFFSGQVIIKAQYAQEATQTANELADSIELLVSLNASNIIVFNLPDIGSTPCYASSSNQAAQDGATLFSTTYNTVLETRIADIEATHGDLNLIYIDTFTIFSDLLTDPSIGGFTNTDDALTEAYDTDPNVDQSQHLFYDDVHPTTAGHEYIAKVVYSKIVPEPSSSILMLSALSLLLIRRRKS